MISQTRFCCARIFVIFGLMFLTFTFSLSLLTYAYPHWITYTPKTVLLRDNWEDYVRRRGIFEECVEEKLEKDPLIYFKYKINNQVCITIDMGQLGNYINDSNYQLIVRLRQSQVGLHGAAVILSFCILIMGLVSFGRWCFHFEETTYATRWRLSIALVCILVFLALAASCSISTALFLYIENEQKYRTKYLPYSEFNIATLQRDYGPMFYIGWITTGFALISSILFLISGCIGEKIKKEKYSSDICAVDNPVFSEDLEKTENIFLAPSISTVNHYPGLTYPVSANDTISPEKLPRSKI